MSDDILANWTQEQAMALEAEGKSSFLLPHEESDEQGDRATDERRGANQGAGVANDSPWRLTEEVGAPEPKLWWIWILLGAALLLIIVSIVRRTRR